MTLFIVIIQNVAQHTW